jgi:hypothetical protein
MAIDPKRGEGLLLAIPFRDDYAVGRGANWEWLKRYWEIELPSAQIVVGEDYGEPFSKTCAVNNAYRKAVDPFDVIVMIDADCYISPVVILNCAEAIRDARRWNEPLWFVPYRCLYRLTGVATDQLVASDPANALQFSTPPNSWDVGSTLGSGIGHRYGALVQIFPREAFELMGGLDPRFRGWGGEDVTTVRVLDTLYGIHRTSENEVLTLWHTAIGDVFLRKWAGQPDTGANDSLAVRYRKTRRDPARMRAIIQEWLDDPQYSEHRIHPAPAWHGTYIDSTAEDRPYKESPSRYRIEITGLNPY